MDSAFKKVMAEYDQRFAEENESIRGLTEEEIRPRLDELLLAVGRHVGRLLNALVKDSRAQTVLEVGGSYGYSTLWFAEAARAVGGKVISLEMRQEKVDYARDRLRRAGLDAHVEHRVGDALEAIETMVETVDLALLDLGWDMYSRCLDLLYPKLSPQAIVVADNMVQPEVARETTRAFQAHIRSLPDIDSVLLPLGTGIEVSRLNSRLS